MLHSYLEGNAVVLVGTCSVVDAITGVETPTDPTTLTFFRLQANGALTSYTWPAPPSPEIVHVGVGVFTCRVVTNEPGQEKWRFETTGACAAAAEDVFSVNESIVV